MKIPDKRILLKTEHEPGSGFRPAIGGEGIGPWLDEPSARFLVEWLTLLSSGVRTAALALGVTWTLQAALHLAPERKFWPSSLTGGGSPLDRPRSIPARPHRGHLAGKVSHATIPGLTLPGRHG